MNLLGHRTPARMAAVLLRGKRFRSTSSQCRSHAAELRQRPAGCHMSIYDMSESHRGNPVQAA